MCERQYYKADIEVWNIIDKAVTPEQGWKIFMSCINYGFAKEPETDQLVDALSRLLMINAEYDMDMED